MTTLTDFDFSWHSVEGTIIPDELESWEKVRHLFPPSFLTVTVKNGRRLRKAYFDAPMRRWIDDTKNIWNSTTLRNVTAWKQMENNTFLQQVNS